MLIQLMKKCMENKRDMVICDGYNNLYRLECHEDDCLMFEHSTTTRIEIPVEVSYDILTNEYYYEL